MKFHIFSMLGLAAGLALSSVPTSAQEPAFTSGAPTEASAATPTTASAVPLKLSNKWRIEVHEGSNNDGTLLFRVTPDQGTATDIRVNVKKGRSENGVASDIKNMFKQALDPKVYHVETDDGEDVLVKKHKHPNFEIKLVESTLKGTRINLDKE